MRIINTIKNIVPIGSIRYYICIKISNLIFFFQSKLMVVIPGFINGSYLVLSGFLILPGYAQETKKDSIAGYEALYKKASKLIDSAKYEQALPFLKKAIKEKPNYWEALNKTAFAKIKLERLQRSIERFR